MRGVLQAQGMASAKAPRRERMWRVRNKAREPGEPMEEQVGTMTRALRKGSLGALLCLRREQSGFPAETRHGQT